MQVLVIRDRGADPEVLDRVVEAAVSELADLGRIGVVRYDATIADGAQTARPAGGDVTYDLGADGDWTGSGTGLTVDDALDSLAPTCDVAVVVGVETTPYPSIVVGEGPNDPAEPVLGYVSDAVDLRPFGLVGALEETEPYETLESLVASVKRSSRADRAGAIATFTGRVRRRDRPDDRPTEYLEFEKYETVADERLATIRTELEARDGVYTVRLHHRTGVVESGEDIVFVVVLAGHRTEAFQTVEDGINRLKDEVPFFKKEVTVDDEFWVHERD